MSTPSWRSLDFTLSWLGIAAAIAIFLGSINLPKFVDIFWNAAQTTGEIKQIDSSQHNMVAYTFLVDGEEYSSQDHSDNCSSLYSGDSIVVYFSKTSPRSSLLDKPISALFNELATIGLACLVLPPFAIWRLHSRRQLGRKQ